MKRLASQDIYLIFDRYSDFSIKWKRVRAGNAASPRNELQLHTRLPPQMVVLTVTENKIQVIELVCQNLIQTAQDEPNEHSLVITSADSVPVVI